jgi:hypothetical protein
MDQQQVNGKTIQFLTAILKKVRTWIVILEDERILITLTPNDTESLKLCATFLARGIQRLEEESLCSRDIPPLSDCPILHCDNPECHAEFLLVGIQHEVTTPLQATHYCPFCGAVYHTQLLEEHDNNGFS